MRRMLILLTVIVAQAIPTVAESREKDLDRWLERELIPYVQQQLQNHPRFRNETVMFVVLRDNVPASASNALALSVRDRLLDAAVATHGIAVGWQQGRSGNSPESQPQDCKHDDVHYYIGIELTQNLDSSYSVDVRALDLEDRNWVTGFGKHWQGRLSTTQRQAMRQARIDETFLGGRDVPFTLAQTDLLAAQLAHKLACTMQKRVADEYVVATDVNEPSASALRGTVELISNNLASRQALTLSSDPGKANAVLGGKAHRIDGVLFQYWLTVTPKGEKDDVTALSASAYIVLPDAEQTTETLARIEPRAEATTVSEVASRADRPAPPISIPNAGKDGLITPLRISSPTSDSECSGEGPRVRAASFIAGSRRCSLLQTDAKADSVVFFLEHQAGHGLVRLGNNECRSRTTARIARRGERLSFPIAETTTARYNWSETHEWQLEPDLDTFYAVVVTDAKVARRMANHIDALPLRCSDAIRPGLEDDELRNWLSDFAMMSAKSSRHVDWRAIRVKDVL